MRAIVHDRYGDPTDLRVDDIEIPCPGPTDVLVRVDAAGVNPLDWHFATGTPYVLRLLAGLRRPKQPVAGRDLAGRVEAIGDDVTGFAVGDAVFGGGRGTFAEFAVASPRHLAAMPTSMTFEQAAALPVAGITALQAVRDHGRVAAGQRVLVTGASGGVGHYAVQIAAAMGADVTGVCSTGNVGLVRSLGASDVVDYTSSGIDAAGGGYDVIVDNVGKPSLRAFLKVLAPNGVYVGVGASKGAWLGPFRRPVWATVRLALSSQRFAGFTAHTNTADLEALAHLADRGAIRSVIDRTYPLGDAPAAVAAVGKWHTAGKRVVAIGDHAETS